MSNAFNWSFERTRLPSSDEIIGLIKFFVWGCPVPDVSVRGITLSEYGWEAGNINTLRAEIRRQSSLTRKTFKAVEKTAELIPKLEELNVYDSFDFSKEFAICCAGGKTDTDAFFYMIRNAIAHGSFCIRERRKVRYLIMETRKDGNLRGRSALRLSTIKTIQSIVKNPQEYLDT